VLWFAKLRKTPLWTRNWPQLLSSARRPGGRFALSKNGQFDNGCDKGSDKGCEEVFRSPGIWDRLQIKAAEVEPRAQP
jgi:hypothetical protein